VAAAGLLRAAVLARLDALTARGTDELLDARWRRWRAMGETNREEPRWE
jgi:hypothetical protein